MQIRYDPCPPLILHLTRGRLITVHFVSPTCTAKTDKRSLLLYFYVFSWNIIVNEFLFSLSFYLLCRFWFQLTTRHIYCKPICKSVELYFSSRSGIFRKFQIYGSERIKSQSVGIAAHEEKMVRKEICWLVPCVCIQVDGPNVPPIILAAASKIFFRLLIHVNFFRSYYNSAHVRFGTVPLRRNVGAIELMDK